MSSSAIFIFPTREQESGGVMFFVAILLLGLITMTAFVMDISRAREKQWDLLSAADRATMSAAEILELSPIPNATNVRARAREIALVNGITNTELSAGGDIDTGNWNRVTQVYTLNGNPLNAVRMRARRNVNLSIGRAMASAPLRPNAESIAYGQVEIRACLTPFAIEAGVIQDGQGNFLNAGDPDGDTFVIGRNSPGNWGKIDMPIAGGGSINMSSGANFSNFMRSGVCNAAVTDNNADGTLNAADNLTFSGATGNGGTVSSLFSEFAGPPAHDFVAMVTSAFGNGQSTVTLQRLARVRVEMSGGTGANWAATLRVIEYLDFPNDYLIQPGARFLVK